VDVGLDLIVSLGGRRPARRRRQRAFLQLLCLLHLLVKLLVGLPGLKAVGVGLR
jgi:hypothetical protein